MAGVRYPTCHSSCAQASTVARRQIPLPDYGFRAALFRRLLWCLLSLPALVWATMPWSGEEIQRHAVTVPAQPRPVPGSPLPFSPNYLLEFRSTCDFVARYQFADSSKPDSFGGIIEAEHLPTVIETDNTQEAIWIWSRWQGLTGDNTYQTNIRRAWSYVLSHPAYREGTGPYVWYSVWNCGLALFAEMCYRQIFGDSSYLAYTDTCRQYLYAHPLNFAANPLHGNVTAFAAGMMYQYALERGDPELRDSALAYGNRVRIWVESQPQRLRTGNWAMSGGTIIWGLCNSIWQADTATGRAWLRIYADSVPYFMPTGQWNCSWNIWNANAFYSVASILHEERFRQYHQRLTDTLLALDVDADGGIPATWTDPPTQDQTWISTYLAFMGMNRFVAPLRSNDVAVTAITGFARNQVYLPGDTIQPAVVIANLSRSAVGTQVTLELPGYSRTISCSLAYLAADTLQFDRFVCPAPGLLLMLAALRPDENPANDSLTESLKVWQPRNITGVLCDSGSSRPILARLILYLLTDTIPFASLGTDSLGRFRFTGIDSTFLVACHPEIPYPDREWRVIVHQDTFWQLSIPPAHLLLAATDTTSRLAGYYTTTFDTMGLSYCRWQRQAGRLVLEPLLRLQDRLIVWYSGNAVTQTIDSAEMSLLAQFLDAGGKLFITGQNIGQELAGTEFYRNRLHARLVNPTLNQVYLYSDTTDSLGRRFGSTQTAGTGGANNQNSRDEIAPDSLARSFLIYDTLTRAVAGIYYADTVTASRLIYLGFGFEAVNRPINRPQFMSRVTFFNQCYTWLTGRTAIAEPGVIIPPVALRVLPNPACGTVRFQLTSTSPVSSVILISDITGRIVARLTVAHGQPNVIWRGTDRFGNRLPTGIYLYRAGTHTGSFRFLR